MKLKTLLNIMLICITVPVMANAVCNPVVSKYFMGAADVEVIASAAIVSQSITMFVAFVGCWSSGLKIFVKLYYPMWITELSIAIIIAMMGAENIGLRFYLHAVQNALCIGIVSQTLGYYSMQVIPRDMLQTFSNKQKTVVGGAGIAGSFLAVMLGNIDIHTALWADVFFSVFSFGMNTFVLVHFKRMVEGKED